MLNKVFFSFESGDQEMKIEGLTPFHQLTPKYATRQLINGELHLNTNVMYICRLPHLTEDMGELITTEHFVDFLDARIRPLFSHLSDVSWSIEVKMWKMSKNCQGRVRTTQAGDVRVNARVAILSEKSSNIAETTVETLKAAFKRDGISTGKIGTCKPSKYVELRYVPAEKAEDWMRQYLSTSDFDKIPPKGYSGATGQERINDIVPFILWVDNKNTQTSIKVCTCQTPP